MTHEDATARVLAWFAEQGWEAFDFQREVWDAYLRGESGLIHSATGTGKTYAAWLGPVIEAVSEGAEGRERTEAPGEPKFQIPNSKIQNPRSAPSLRVLWITPLRALAADTAAALHEPLAALGLEWTVETRTGDTSAAVRSRQKERLPNALVTTPESLSLFLSREDARGLFGNLRCVVVDEWHELMATKRGVQTELGLARLRGWNPKLRTWGVSATLGNLSQAAEVLIGPGAEARIVRGTLPKMTVIDSLLPDTIDRFPWAGHLGTQMLPKVIEAIEGSRSTLLFTNTRSQAEIWHRAILEARPDWKGHVEIHHGSIDREVRDAVERGIKLGILKAVVCTSSLDLGVDFSPVERVLQIGSPKGVARILQRAGRSGHQPGVPSRVSCVPTHALELMDVAAVRDAASQGRIEQRPPVERPLDVLVQHLVTVAIGGGFRSKELLEEVRNTFSYRELSDQEWQWAIDFVTKGGTALGAYEEYRKVVERDGLFVVDDKKIARRHRMAIGTITSDAAMAVQFVSGGKLGTVEESFIARLRPGDKFVFSGRPLIFVRVKDNTAYVRAANSTKGAIPRWMGGRLPLSTELAASVREKLEEASYGALDSPELQVLRPLLELQARWSALPAMHELLIERVQTRDGHHLFMYPVEGRLVHEGLAALFAYRLSRVRPITFAFACNDYGLELLSPEPAPLDEALEEGLLSPFNLAAEIPESLNAAELGRRQFREIARVAGLVFQGFPGAHKTARQLQASSGLFYDVFARYDPENLLLAQADREVLERQLEQTRLARALERLSRSRLLITEPPRPTPLSFPILVDRLRASVSSESIGDRIERMTRQLERAADRG